MVKDKVACFLLDEEVVKNCNNCSLREICKGIDKAILELN